MSSSPLQAIIVDDEHHCRHNLAELLSEYCPEIQVYAMAASAKEALEQIEDTTPDVLFLDIRMPGMTGFELLEHLPNRAIQVVFTTAHDEYALRALKEGAVDYLEKPISIDELEACVQKLVKRKESSSDATPSWTKEMLKLANLKELDRTTIPTADGFVMVKSSEIIHLEAAESYTRIFLSTGERHLSSKNIRVFEQRLNPQIFFRTHKSHIVNVLYHLKGFSRTDGNVALMSDGTRVPISRRKLGEFLERVQS
ncbi:MAG: response regulator transcription factor [Flavobacteriales bacterium]|nr:response regulator transcription factor [Flavobacteriales bacterium]